MEKLPKKLQSKLEERNAKNALQWLPSVGNLVDFSFNDYLGLSKIQQMELNTMDLFKNI